ncbi:hypothetical protein DYB30_002235 [Aphanomyces astaci]|uniref:Neurotransmitter-gated ion-channel transmembrane domain-containing protein n=1 Tax=Aphanomyces astaci TaxID=112090 RepID=A0A397EYX8_APHAT|nr:hypothetical protein DYB30_002235 [Aphanomyces astaci]RHZ08211.1 hypothetical protein DYB31_003449 [Aphanomyces astaci]
MRKRRHPSKVCAAATINEEDVAKRDDVWHSDVVGYELRSSGFLVVTVQRCIPPDLVMSNVFIYFRGGGPGGVWWVSHANTTGCVLTCTSKSKLPHSEWDVTPPLVDGENVVLRQRTKLPEGDPPSSFTADASVPPATISCAILPPLVSYCRTTVFNVFEINTVLQTFRADAFFELRFRTIAASDVPQASVVDLLDSLYINTSVVECLNTASVEGDVQSWSSYTPSTHHKGTLMDYCLKLRFKGCFSEMLELWPFPFDTQGLTMSLTINRPTSYVVFRSNDDFPSVFLVNRFAISNLFHVVTAEHVLPRVGVSAPAESSQGYRYSCIDFTVILQRKPGYYVSNVMVPITILTYLGFLSFGIESFRTRMATSNRISISVTLLLTAVAYKFAIAGALPQISYLTSLDWYVTMSSVVMVVVTVENAVFPWLCVTTADDDVCFDTEQTVMWTMFVLFTGGVVGSVVVMWWASVRRRNANDTLVAQHQVRLLAAKDYPTACYKSRRAMVDHVLAKMNLPRLEWVHQKTNHDTSGPYVGHVSTETAKAHLAAFVAADDRNICEQ